ENEIAGRAVALVDACGGDCHAVLERQPHPLGRHREVALRADEFFLRRHIGAGRRAAFSERDYLARYDEDRTVFEFWHMLLDESDEILVLRKDPRLNGPDYHALFFSRSSAMPT